VTTQAYKLINRVTNQRGSSIASVMKEFVLPSNNRRGIGSIGLVCRTCFHTKADSIKQCVELESTKALDMKFGTGAVDKHITRDVERDRAEALIFTSICAQPESMQPSECVEAKGSLISFSAWKPGQ
jgi:hypothetical protein